MPTLTPLLLVSKTPHPWEVPTTPPLWERPTTALFLRPTWLNRQSLQAQLAHVLAFLQPKWAGLRAVGTPPHTYPISLQLRTGSWNWVGRGQPLSQSDHQWQKQHHSVSTGKAKWLNNPIHNGSHNSAMQQKESWYPDRRTSAWCHMPSGNKIGALATQSHYRCANYDGYCKSQRRNPDQLPCGGVLIYIKKGLYHKVVQIDSHLQAIAVQVTLGGTPITILSVYIPGNNHLTTRDLSNLIRNIRGQILITGNFKGHNYMWGRPDVDTRGEIIERFTDKHNLCILNDGTHTYLKPEAQLVNRPTSAIDLTIFTPGLAGSVWDVLPMAVTIIPYWLQSYHQWQRYNQAVILPTGFFPRPIGNSFMMCVGKAFLRIY